MTEESSVVMAFDYGLRNIGIAIGQNITKSASTFYAIKAKERIKTESSGLIESANKHSVSAQIILEDWFRSMD